MVGHIYKLSGLTRSCHPEPVKALILSYNARPLGAAQLIPPRAASRSVHASPRSYRAQFNTRVCGSVVRRKHPKATVTLLVDTGVVRQSPPEAQLGLDPSQHLLWGGKPLEKTEAT